jgi:hypothetical protein
MQEQLRFYPAADVFGRNVSLRQQLREPAERS